MKEKYKLPKKYLVLEFKCRDLETYMEGIEYQKCHYCMHLKEENKPIEEWVCKMPSREAQRRHFAYLDNKQKVLL
jgi:hypothetical protein